MSSPRNREGCTCSRAVLSDVTGGIVIRTGAAAYSLPRVDRAFGASKTETLGALYVFSQLAIVTFQVVIDGNWKPEAVLTR